MSTMEPIPIPLNQDNIQENEEPTALVNGAPAKILSDLFTSNGLVDEVNLPRLVVQEKKSSL